MRILLAPSAYKGSFSPIQLGEALHDAIVSVSPDFETTIIPIADGGDGTIQSIHHVIDGEIKSTNVIGPLDFAVNAQWLKLGAMAVVELASASGIAHLSQRKTPPKALDAHTSGTGQVIKDCLDKGEKELVICVGGSASTDGGMGALAALGGKFLDRNGRPVANGGGSLAAINSIDLSGLDARLKNTGLRVATDVRNPLLGPTGASAIYAPQKGASEHDVEELERGLKNFADLLEGECKRDVRNLPGAGAAGGCAFGLVCALGANLVSGFAWLCDLVELKSKIAKSDLVITCEGQLDQQSLSGKATGELAKICLNLHKPLWVIPAKAQTGVNWLQSGIEKVLPSASNGDASLEDVKRVCAIALAEAEQDTRRSGSD